MERKIDSFLYKWKEEKNRKPLIIYGPRQVGKTFSVLALGNKKYKNTIYFNTNNNEELINLFKKEKAKDRIIAGLSKIKGEAILEDDSLIIFDNLEDQDIARGIKLFGTTPSNYHIIGITTRPKVKNIKGEELQFKSMNEMDFEEYLIAHNEKELVNLIRNSFENRKTCRFHELALELFRKYLITGGLPEVVDGELRGYDENRLDSIKQKISDIYEKETLSNPNLIDITRSVEVLNSAPKQLLKKNKKFQYGSIKKGTRKKEYEKAINKLVDNQLLYKSYKVKEIKSPLSSCKDKNSFKLYLPDDGLLYTSLHLTEKKLLTDENIKEAIYENHIAKTLTEGGYSLYYYQSEGKAELSFVVQNRKGEIIPIELTVRKDSKAKALSVFMTKFKTERGIRVTENNFSTKKNIRYIPIYSLFLFK